VGIPQINIVRLAEKAGSWLAHTFIVQITSLSALNAPRPKPFMAALCNDSSAPKLSPSCPQVFVDKVCTIIRVGSPQREEIKHWRGLPRGAFGYNESPTSSCHTFCWKARQKFDVPFF
jgi:hypothetical protein